MGDGSIELEFGDHTEAGALRPPHQLLGRQALPRGGHVGTNKWLGGNEGAHESTQAADSPVQEGVLEADRGVRTAKAVEDVDVLLQDLDKNTKGARALQSSFRTKAWGSSLSQKGASPSLGIN